MGDFIFMPRPAMLWIKAIYFWKYQKPLESPASPVNIDGLINNGIPIDSMCQEDNPRVKLVFP